MLDRNILNTEKTNKQIYNFVQIRRNDYKNNTVNLKDDFK